MQNQIVKNTVYLYIRQIVYLFVSLYTARIVLDILGAVDYGIYNVVAGFVSIFSIVCSSLNNATQRFLSIHKVKDDICQVFSTAFLLHFLMAILVVLLLETIGFIGFSELNIPQERMSVAQWVFHISVFTMFLTITQVPYNALIIANERMKAFSQISILEVVLKLLLVLGLTMLQLDKLKLYAILMFFSSCVVMSIYRVYCHRHFKEQILYSCSLSNNMIKKMVSFSGWSFFSSFVWVIKGQGVNVLLNLFFGPVVNAARGIINQISNIASSFMLNFQTAANPKINQFYALGEYRQMENLVYQTVRISFFLMLTILVPIFIEIDIILDLWLKNPPEYANVFCRILIIELLIDSVTGPLFTAIKATGKIKRLSTCEFGILIWNIPITWLFFKLGFGPQTAYIVSALLTVIAVVVRHIILFKQLPFTWREYFQSTQCRIILVACFAIPANFIGHIWLSGTFLMEVLWCVYSVLATVFIIYTLGVSKHEREVICGILKAKVGSIKRKLPL